MSKKWKQLAQRKLTTRSNSSNIDPDDLAIIQWIYDNAHINDYKNDGEAGWQTFLDSRIMTYPANGRIRGANLQGNPSVGGYRFFLIGDNQLPENFGDLTELNYLDIGLYNSLYQLPSSIGNLFHYSEYELIERNGGPEANIEFVNNIYSGVTGFYECKDLYDNLKWWPHPDFSWQALYDYIYTPLSGHIEGCGVVWFNNIHLDGNYDLGPPGTIPESINNWKKLHTLYQGFGTAEMILPIDFKDWEVWAVMNGAAQNLPSGFEHSTDICRSIPHWTNGHMNWLDQGHQDPDWFGWLYLIPKWTGWHDGVERCSDIWALMPGDVNNDGELNILDVVELVNTWVELDGNVPVDQFPQYDFNSDGLINIQDIVSMIYIIFNNSNTTLTEKEQLKNLLKKITLK